MKQSPSYNSTRRMGAADARRVLQHGLEYRFQLARSAADDRSTSEVAVCCSSDPPDRGFAHLLRRTAVHSRSRSTAWLAKVVTSFDLLVVNGFTTRHQRNDADPAAALVQGHAEHRPVLSRALVSKALYSGSARQSGRWTVFCSSAVRRSGCPVPVQADALLRIDERRRRVVAAAG